MKTWLLDTGPLVAWLDAADEWHERVAAALAPFRGRLSTTGVVIAETMHFLGPAPGGPASLGEFLRTSRTAVFDFCQPDSVAAAAGLMSKYADTPMEFADATLVLLADALEVRDVLTLDFRGFTVFRDGRGRPFRSVLAP